MKYRIYIDEVGNPDLESSDNPNHRYLSLTGIILELEYVAKKVQPELELLKSRYFRPHPDEPIIFHRKEMLNRRFPFEILRDIRVREQFDNDLLKHIKEWDFVIITICLDKKRHKDTYTTWRYDPYHYCLAMLLERYVLFLKRMNAIGDAIAESRGGKEDRRLKDSYERLVKDGSPYIEACQFQKALSSTQLKVKPKANNIAGLQLADILAHPSRNEILQENEVLQRAPDSFGAKICAILEKKYDQVNGQIYGKKFT